LANLRAIRDASSWNELAIGPKIACWRRAAQNAMKATK